MKLEFDINNIRKNKLELLDCQVDLILKSLELYCYIYQYIYPRRGKCETKEENLRISLVTDTYEQIANQYANFRNGNLVLSIDSEDDKNFFKKVS